METIDVYRAVCVQPRVKLVTKREDIKENLKRAIDLIDYASYVSSSPYIQEAKFSYRPFSPVKLIAFPESFLKGWLSAKAFKDIDVKEHIKRGIVIEIPGEETELLGEKAGGHF